MKKIATILSLAAFVLSQACPAIAGVKPEELVPLVCGLVKSTEGTPLKAVISVKKGKEKTSTNEQGMFYLHNVRKDAVIVIAYSGIKTEINLDGREKLRLTLVDPLSQMKGGREESVDTGYGSIKKENYTGSSMELTAADIEKGGFNSLVDAMRVNLGGITVTDDGLVSMRGINTFEGSIYALIVCDGTEIGSVLDVEVHDVKSLTVLKDGDMYGAKGANGVVVISTKTN